MEKEKKRRASGLLRFFSNVPIHSAARESDTRRCSGLRFRREGNTSFGSARAANTTPNPLHFENMVSSSTHTPARLVLADGTVYRGSAFGAVEASAAGEVVFNTAMTGYQEALTDPSYAGQILVMTAPMIGNYGVAREDVESDRPQVAAFVVRELSRMRSNFRSYMELPQWLAQHGVPGIQGVDTRAIVRRLRTAGVMNGLISADSSKSDAELIELARAIPSMSGMNLAAQVSTREQGMWQDLHGDAVQDAPAEGRPFRVAALDCGGKHNIYRHLAQRGCEVVLLPHNASMEQIQELKPDGLFISNGPGDPAAVAETVATLRQAAGEVPTFGICLGHQLLALALGAKTYKLKFGHRGANQPVRNLLTGAVEITSQNHGFCVDERSLRDAGCEVTHRHLNDETVAGFRHLSKPIFAVQHHPEASPGPHDAGYLFDCFLEMMRSARPLDADMVRSAREGRLHSAAVTGP